MTVQQGEFVQRVLGRRLSYLSRHDDVRQSILGRLKAGEDLLVIVRNIDVAGVQVDVLGDDKGTFVEALNRLKSGVGDEYSLESPDDNPDNRNHLWRWWAKHLNANARLNDRVRESAIAVLSCEMPVDVGGEYAGSQPGVSHSSGEHPRLTFRGPAAELPGATKLAGEVPEE